MPSLIYPPPTVSLSASADDVLLGTGTWGRSWATAQPINAQTGTTYTPVAGDVGKLVTLSNASAVVLTLPADGTVSWAVGRVVDALQLGAGQVSVSAAVGVTILVPPDFSAKSSGIGGQFRIQKIAANTYRLSGDLAEAQVLPPPDPSNRTPITTSDNPTTILAANPNGRFLVKAGTHLSREFNCGSGSPDILCEPGVILDGQNSTSLSAVYGTGNNVTFRGWDENNMVEIRNYTQTANDTTCVCMGPKNAESWNLRTGWKMGYLWLHDNGVVNVRPGNSSYLGYCLSETAYGLAVGGGGISTESAPSIIEHNIFRYSNTSNDPPGNQGGNSKFVCQWAIIRYNTFAGYRTHAIASTTPGTTHDDFGLWLDVDCTDYDIYGNVIEDIYRAGMVVEISGRGKIHGNTIRRVGFRQAEAFEAEWGSTFASGIQISSSGSGPDEAGVIDIYDNDLSDCYEGITAYHAPRGKWQRFPTYEHNLVNIHVHDNTLTRCGPSGIINDAQTAWANGQSYTAGTGPEYYNASHRVHTGRIYRCILAHTSSTGVNEPSGTSADNTWWRFQQVIPTNISLSNIHWWHNTYVNCGVPAGETAFLAATNDPFYHTGSGTPDWAEWQALGHDQLGSFTGTPGYISS